MIAITLKYGGVEKTLAAWGYSAPTMRLRSRGVSTFTVEKTADDPANAADIPFEGQVIIYGTLAGENGGVKEIIFQGRRTDFDGRANPQEAATSMTFSDGWYDLEHIIFQHYWSGRAVGAGANANFYFSRYNLFQDIHLGPTSPWGYLTADHQIVEIVNYAQTNCGGALQIGSIDPAWNVPLYGVKALSCAEALLKCIQTIPDAITYFDYTTTPPTLHIKQRGSLAAVTLPWGGTDGNGTSHVSSTIRPRPDLQPSQVVIQYQVTNTVNDKDYVNFVWDVWPGGSTGNAIRALVVPIDIRGGKRSTVSGMLTSALVDPTNVAFWTANKVDLADTNITGLAIADTTINDNTHPTGITITDEAGAYVSIATFANELISGAAAPWMKDTFGVTIAVKEVTVTGFLSYTKKKAGATTAEQIVVNHPVSCRIKLTNSAAGAIPYSTLASSEQGETVITGLAENIYVSLSTLQWEGEHTVVEADTYQIIGPKNVLNLSGGNADWATMAAQIYETEIDFFHGRTHVSFGPHKYLTPEQFFDLLQMWRWRQVYDNPNVRNSGQDSGASTVAFGQHTAKENTTEGLPPQSLLTVATAPDAITHNQVVIQKDAVNKQFVMQTVSSAGANVPAQPSVLLKLDDLGALAGVGRIAKWRLMPICDGSGASKQAYVAMTAPE